MTLHTVQVIHNLHATCVVTTCVNYAAYIHFYYLHFFQVLATTIYS